MVIRLLYTSKFLKLTPGPDFFFFFIQLGKNFSAPYALNSITNAHEFSDRNYSSEILVDTQLIENPEILVFKMSNLREKYTKKKKNA